MRKITKAVILAAGEGVRLRPLTEACPKCLLKIAGHPLLDYWLESIEKAGLKTVFVNGFYLAGQVEDFLKEASLRYDLDIRFRREEKLTGTGGFLKKLLPELKEDDAFFVCHGDNFSNIDIGDFLRFHIARKSDLSLALFRTDTPCSCGIVESIRADGLIDVFREKPSDPKSNLASAAMFLMSPSVLSYLPDAESIDFSKEVLPFFQGRMYGYEITGYNIDIGTPDAYLKACKAAEGGHE